MPPELRHSWLRGDAYRTSSPNDLSQHLLRLGIPNRENEWGPITNIQQSYDPIRAATAYDVTYAQGIIDTYLQPDSHNRIGGGPMVHRGTRPVNPSDPPSYFDGELTHRYPNPAEYRTAPRWTAAEPTAREYRPADGDRRREVTALQRDLEGVRQNLRNARQQATIAEARATDAEEQLAQLRRLHETALTWRDMDREDRARLRAFRNFCDALDSLPVLAAETPEDATAQA